MRLRLLLQYFILSENTEVTDSETLNDIIYWFVERFDCYAN